MRPTIRTDEYAVAAIITAAETLAETRDRARTDITYLQTLTELAATATALITTTIAGIEPHRRDWDAIATALGTTPAQAPNDHQPPPSLTTEF
ncbi:MAG: hypothetical protein ACYC1Z_14785 [Georgenia sp.]